MTDIAIKNKNMSYVNLEALIKREDLFIINDKNDGGAKFSIDKIRLEADLKPDSLMLKTLRKPDFQRETSEWKPERIAGLIKSFINDDIIPSIILWHSPSGNNFVIDGAHRLSALIAWVMDDYGDRAVSENFFGKRNIPKEQYKIADKTRKLVASEVGAFESYNLRLIDENKADPEVIKVAKNLAFLSIQVQTINTQSPEAAESSFFKINGEATPINDTEALILKSRKKPNSISARAIIHSGTGHEYWSKFNVDIKDKIKLMAKEINELLFQPEYETPIKTVDLPMAGKGYSAQTLELIFNLVNIVNEIKIVEWKKIKNAKDIEPADDETGDSTLEYLKKTKKIADIIAGDENYSLGLSPIVYFYSIDGRYQITAFMAIVELLKGYTKDDFFKFTIIRGMFEEFIVKYKSMIKQIVSKYGSGHKSYKRIQSLFSLIIDTLLAKLKNGVSKENELWDVINAHKDFKYLRREETEMEPANRKEFSTETKSAINIRARLKTALKCPFCDGIIFNKSQNTDHIIDKKNNGLGDIDNGQITHYYCNSSKDKLLEYFKNNPKEKLS